MGMYLSHMLDDGSKKYILGQLPSKRIAEGDIMPDEGWTLICLVHNGAFNALGVAYDDGERRAFLETKRQRFFFSVPTGALKDFMTQGDWRRLTALQPS